MGETSEPCCQMTAVPKISVAKNRYLLPREHNVWTSLQRADGNPVSKAQAPEALSEQHLGLGVALSTVGSPG
jgi:hypothetical protein